MDRAQRLKRLGYRAAHRGTREADMLIGRFFAAASPAWDDDALDWFEALLEEQDVDILAWAAGVTDAPANYHGPALEALKRLDYLPR